MLTERQVSPFVALARLLVFLKPYRLFAAGALVLALLASAATLAIPVVGRNAIDHVIATRDLADLNRAFALLAVLWAVSVTLNLLRDLTANQLGHSVVADLRRQLITHALRLPISYFDETHSANVTTRLSHDTEQLRRTMAEDVIKGLGDLALVCGAAAFLLILDWRLTAALLALALAIPVAHLCLSPRMRSLNRSTLEAMSDLLSRTADAIANIRLVKAFGRESHEDAIASRGLDRLFEVATRTSRYESFMWSGLFAMFGVIALGLVWYSLHEVVAGRVSLGAMLAYLYTVSVAAAPLTSLAGIAGRAQRAQACADRVHEVIDLPVEAQDPPDARALKVTRGEIEFRNVGFAYDPAQPVLTDFTLDIPRGRTTALVGATGAGKSTVISLLLRFYDPASGDIRIDGTPISTVARRSLREAFGVVEQDALLFSGTIRENIRYGRLDASDADVARAAAAAHVDEFTDRWQTGLDTTIGERGVRLSGGQRQRIAIARAILRDAPILLLDEATSSLDAESEALVHDALRTLMSSRTTLLIAHRMRTVVEHADQIAVLDSGRIVAFGTHVELGRTSARYRELFAAVALAPSSEGNQTPI